MPNLGTGYVQIIPSAKGLSGAIADLMSPEASSAGQSAGGIFGGGLLSAAKTTIIAGAAAVGAGLVAVTKSAVSQFAEYEQLVGGAQLMFGDAYDYVAKQAANAYKNVQLSQNDYLTQVNGFATGLKTAMNGNEMAAAKLADKIVTAEADIVAATGRTQEDVQNAFNGIMRSNFTMLDNLGLGITPTKEGFQQIIDKVNEWNAANGEATQYVIDNYADCEAALVDYISMVGMSGYAQAEASKTIQGSLESTKAAWSNLLVGLATGTADLNVLMGNLAQSAMSLFENVIPVIGNVISALPQMISTFIAEGIPMALQAGVQLVGQIATGIVQGIPQILTGITQMITNVADMLTQNGPEMIRKGVELIAKLAEGFVSNIPAIISGAGQAMTQLLAAILQNLPALLSAGVQLIAKLAAGIIQNIPAIIAAVSQVMAQFIAAIVGQFGNILAKGVELIAKLAAGVVQGIPKLIAQIPVIFSNFMSGIMSQSWSSIGSNIISGIAAGIRNGVGTIIAAAKSAALSAFNAAKKALGISSPSKLFRDEVGYFIPAGIGEGIRQGQSLVDDALKTLTDHAVYKVGISAGDFSNARIPAGANGEKSGVKNQQKSYSGTDVNTYLDGKRVGGAIGNYNAQQMRRYGRVQAAY